MINRQLAEAIKGHNPENPSYQIHTLSGLPDEEVVRKLAWQRFETELFFYRGEEAHTKFILAELHKILSPEQVEQFNLEAFDFEAHTHPSGDPTPSLSDLAIFPGRPRGIFARDGIVFYQWPQVEPTEAFYEYLSAEKRNVLWEHYPVEDWVASYQQDDPEFVDFARFNRWIADVPQRDIVRARVRKMLESKTIAGSVYQRYPWEDFAMVKQFIEGHLKKK